MKTSPLSLAFWIGVFLFSVYLLSFSGKLHVMDELAVFTAGNNLAQHSRADINQLIWTNHWTPNPPGIWGQDGNLYTKKAPGISFVTAPLLWLGHRLPGLNTIHVGLLTNSIVTALTAALLFSWLVDLGFSRPAAILTGLGYGLCTIAWVYARQFWELSILGLCFLIAIRAVHRATAPAHARRRWLWLLLSGSVMALGLSLRFEAAVAIIFVGLYLLLNRRVLRHPPAGFRLRSLLIDPSLIIYLTPSLLIGLGLVYFNFVRYGSLSETGYSQEILFRKPWVGGFGLLFSPGNGLFLYAPFMLLLFFGLRPAWRRLARSCFWLIVAVCLFYWLFYGSWFAWGGVWSWGPRFFLPVLPLLMVFVAEPLEWTLDTSYAKANLVRTLAWIGIGLLVALSLVVNFLGIAVDFNEYFLRLGRNDNFTFNWQAFPPLGHWRILQEGLVDLIWLRPHSGRLAIEWPVLAPALILFGLATVGLVMAIRKVEGHRPSPSTNPKVEGHRPSPSIDLKVEGRRPSPSINPPGKGGKLEIFGLLLTIFLTYQMMIATARVASMGEQAQTDLPVLETLAAAAHAGDSLLVPMPPFGDVQELSSLTMAYLDRPLPVSAWIESEPRAIQPDERERVWQATQAEAKRVWLFERWLTRDDPISATTARFNREAFPVQEQWFERSGKLTLYALVDNSQPAQPALLDIPFQGGLTLVDYAVFGNTVAPGEILKVRLTWQAPQTDRLAAEGLPVGGIVGFVHLLDQTPSAQNVAQLDRLLLDLQNVEQSALLPGQKIQQGYGLYLPADLAAGSYPLITGLYVAGTGQRLRRIDGNPDDFLYLTNIMVQ